MLLISYVSSFTLPPCIHDQPISQCSCVDRFYVNKTVSNSSLLCHINPKISSVTENLINFSNTISYTVASAPCPSFAYLGFVNRNLAAQLHNSNFYCYNTNQGNSLGSSKFATASYVKYFSVCLSDVVNKSGVILNNTYDGKPYKLIC